MPNVAGSVLVTRARQILQDESNVAQRWTDATLLNGLNEGQRSILLYKPDAYTLRDPYDASSGGTTHTVPEDAIALIKVTRNMGLAGSTPGKAITEVLVDHMDAADADWHVAEPSNNVIHFMKDPLDEKRFFLWPPSTGFVEILYSALPADLTVDTDLVVTDPIHDSALIAYMVYYGFSQDTDNAASMALADKWFGQFVQYVTGKILSEDAIENGKRKLR